MQVPLMDSEAESLRSYGEAPARSGCEGDGRWAPIRVSLPRLLWRWMALSGAPTLGTGPHMRRALRKSWRHSVTLIAFAYVGIYAGLIVSSLDSARPALFVLVDNVFVLQGAAYAFLLLRLRWFVDVWTDGRSLWLPACGPATPRMADLARSTATPTTPVAPRKAVAVPSVLCYFIVVAGIPTYLATSSSQQSHHFDSGRPCWFDVVGGTTLFVADATVAAVPWIAAILLSVATDAATPRAARPLAALNASVAPPSESGLEGGGASRRVWAAYRDAVRQADALSSQFASMWLGAVIGTALGIVASVLTAWNAAFGTDKVVHDPSSAVFVLSAYSMGQCLALGMLLRQAALLHTRASATLAQAAATEGDMPLSDRGALYSMLQQRPIAFTVCGVAITEGLLLRVLAGVATGILPPMLKLLLAK